jgi:hypothetical protein
MLKRALQLVLVLVACGGYGCGDKLYPGLAPEGAVTDGEPTDPNAPPGSRPSTRTCVTSPKYAVDVQPLMTKYCTPCHALAATNRYLAPVAYNYDTYANSSATADDALVRIEGTSMPPSINDAKVPAMSAVDICTFKNWVETGKAP